MPPKTTTEDAMNRRFLITAGLIALGLQGQLAADDALAMKSGCIACHKADAKVVGPSYKDIAEKYRGQDVAAQLAATVKSGSQGGKWGAVPMPPSPAPEADVLTVVKWILSSH
jgi:cytochrome c